MKKRKIDRKIIGLAVLFFFLGLGTGAFYASINQVCLCQFEMSSLVQEN